jgi:hypothetical protein
MMGDISQVEDMTLEQIAATYPDALPATRLAQIENELAKIR